MNITNVLTVILDSGEKEYAGLFEPSDLITWISDKAQKLAERVSFYHTSACFPYFKIDIKIENRVKFLNALLECMEMHKIELDKDVSVYFDKSIDELTEDEHEVNHCIEKTWVVDDYADLLICQKSLNTLINNIKKELEIK